MAKVSIAARLENISIDNIEALFLSIIYPNKCEYTSQYSKMYYFENEIIWVTCEISKWDLLDNGLYYTYIVILYNKSLKESIGYIYTLIDILNEHQIEVRLECEEQDNDGNVLIDEFVVNSKEDLLKLKF